MPAKLSPTIELVHDDGWTGEDKTYVRGTMFLEGEKLETVDFLKTIAETQTRDQLLSLLQEANGQYAIIHLSDDGWHIAVDHIRSQPIYYSLDGGLCISDNSVEVHKYSNRDEYDSIAATEYLFTSYVNGPETLSVSVRQLQPGELVTFSRVGGELQVTKDAHFRFNPEGGSKAPQTDDLDALFDRIVQRLIDYADEDPIILPLTGGYDSRLIALKLAEHDYDNVVSYTNASSEDSEDLLKARTIARDLGFKHVRLQSSRDEYREFYSSGDWFDFQESVGYLGELPKTGSRLASKRLQNHPELPDHGIRVPGHHALGGSSKLPRWLQKRTSLSKEEFLNFIWNYTYVRWRIDPRNKGEKSLEKELRNRILSCLPSKLYYDSSNEPIDDAVAGLDTYFWQNRLPKYFLTHYENSAEPYDRWYPLVDKEYFEFLQEISWQHRVDKKIQKEYVKKLGRRIGDDPLFHSDDFESSSGAAFTSGTGSSVKNHIWNRSTLILSRVPKNIEYLIKRIYYRYYSRSDEYHSNPKFAVVPEEFFKRVDLRVAHRRPLQLLLLYHRGYFELKGENILDEAIKNVR